MVVAFLLSLADRGASQGVIRPTGPGVTPAPSASDAPYQPAEPTAHYGSYPVACDSLRALVRRALGRWSHLAGWRRTREPFRFVLNEGADTTIAVPCLRMSYAHHDSTAPGYDEIEGRLRQAGWTIDDRYDADGTDGTVFVLLCREAMVEIDARWEGGDDSDTTYVPPPGQSLTLRCVPRFPRHVP